ncbi:hypothetical protein G5B46_03030 [Caulobacter sp. 602-2]|uniref:Uncharacterized protein n=1 Tax=Caulobacter sp. 602-2 TaxID=2710887 RepID=A0A6G4QSE7_9CAUL|nr:hypothetical protein [Caulobacter sp. 602-2]NGM48576.1 hypothetical protein [Caulobacter sp. 602-2]
MRNQARVLSAGLASAALAGALLVSASAQAQCAMWCPNGAETGDALITEFSTVQRAQAGCKGDEVVWAQNKRVYHKAGWKKFGKTPGGSYICKASAGKVKLKPANLFQRFL